jgi:hypothetical protein
MASTPTCQAGNSIPKVERIFSVFKRELAGRGAGNG